MAGDRVGRANGIGLERRKSMRAFFVLLFAITLASCRGEPVPRDYQNHPPTMTNPPDSKAEAPSQTVTSAQKPEPNTGVEGKTVGPASETAATTTLKDTVPANPPKTTS